MKRISKKEQLERQLKNAIKSGNKSKAAWAIVELERLSEYEEKKKFATKRMIPYINKKGVFCLQNLQTKEKRILIFTGKNTVRHLTSEKKDTKYYPFDKEYQMFEIRDDLTLEQALNRCFKWLQEGFIWVTKLEKYKKIEKESTKIEMQRLNEIQEKTANLSKEMKKIKDKASDIDFYSNGSKSYIVEEMYQKAFLVQQEINNIEKEINSKFF